MAIDGATRLQKGFAMKQAPTPAEMDRKLRDVAELYEKQFMREMVKSMRTTVSKSDLVKTSQAEGIYSEQLDEQYVESWGKRGGIGLADMIHEQLLQRFGEQFGIKPPTEKPRGPLNMAGTSGSGAAGKDVSGLGFSTKTDAANKGLEFKVQDAAKKTHEVSPAWNGVLASIEKNQDGDNLLGIDHDGGFRSLMQFKGELASNLQPGPVAAGQSLGVWDSAGGAMNWKLNYGPDSTTE